MAINLHDIGSGYNLANINANFQLIEDFLNNDVLKREIESGEQNEMRTHLDMNQNVIVNASEVIPADRLEEALTLLGYPEYEDNAARS